IAERKDVLAALFWMLTLLAYVFYTKRPEWGRYLLLVIVFALGLMAKPMLVTLPAVLLLLDVWPLRRISGQPSAVSRQPSAVRSQEGGSRFPIPDYGLLFLEKV